MQETWTIASLSLFQLATIHRLLLTHSPVVPLAVYVGKLHKQSVYGSLCAYMYTLLMLISTGDGIQQTENRQQLHISPSNRAQSYECSGTRILKPFRTMQSSHALK